MKKYTKEQIEKAYQQWKEDYLNNPDSYEEDYTSENYARNCADYLCNLMDEDEKV